MDLNDERDIIQNLAILPNLLPNLTDKKSVLSLAMAAFGDPNMKLSKQIGDYLWGNSSFVTTFPSVALYIRCIHLTSPLSKQYNKQDNPQTNSGYTDSNSTISAESELNENEYQSDLESENESSDDSSGKPRLDSPLGVDGNNYFDKAGSAHETPTPTVELVRFSSR